MNTGMKRFGWTEDFSEFREKVEPFHGPFEELEKKYPDVYAHSVLSHGFMEYAGVLDIQIYIQ